jgi:predicted protein tyrosine phosphatase
MSDGNLLSNRTITSAFLSRREAEQITADYNSCKMTSTLVPFGKKIGLISMVTPGADRTEVDGFWQYVLRLEFHDVDPSHMNRDEACGYKLFSVDDATKIIEFLLTIEPNVDMIWAHCEAGISRSAAVAKFISYVYGARFPDAYQLYNKHVFSTLLRVYRQRGYAGQPVPGFH